MQKREKNTTLLIEGSIAAVEDGTRIAEQTASAIYATVESTKRAVDTVEKITDAAERQAESVAEVTQGVDQISSVVQTNSATAGRKVPQVRNYPVSLRFSKDL